jgi:hypothetical protein
MRTAKNVRSHRARLVAAGSVLLALTVATVLAGPPASAAIRPVAHGLAQPAAGGAGGGAIGNVCGTGYTLLAVFPIVRAGVTFGAVRIYYSSTTKNNCAATVHYAPYVGVKMDTYILLDDEITLLGPPADDGNYGSYAGPVYLYDPGHCIAWEGGINGIYIQGTGFCK